MISDFDKNEVLAFGSGGSVSTTDEEMRVLSHALGVSQDTICDTVHTMSLAGRVSDMALHAERLLAFHGEVEVKEQNPKRKCYYEAFKGSGINYRK